MFIFKQEFSNYLIADASQRSARSWDDAYFMQKFEQKGHFLLSRVKMVTRLPYGIQIIHFLWLSVLKGAQPSTVQHNPVQPSKAK